MKDEDEKDDKRLGIDEPVRRLRGMRIVVEALKLEDFPLTKADIDYAVGDVEVEDGRGGFVPVRDLTDRIRQEDFDTVEQATQALEEARDTLSQDVA